VARQAVARGGISHRAGFHADGIIETKIARGRLGMLPPAAAQTLVIKR